MKLLMFLLVFTVTGILFDGVRMMASRLVEYGEGLSS